MDISTEKAALRITILDTVLHHSGTLPIGAVRSVLAEVEKILISESDNVRMPDIAERLSRRFDALREAR